MDREVETARQDQGYGNTSQNHDRKYQMNQSATLNQSSGISLTKSGFKKMRIRFIKSLPTTGIMSGQVGIMREDFAERMIREGKAIKLGYV
jgi:hypothetical protein